MSSDPWRDIDPPSASRAVNAKRVDELGRWDFFWARDLDGRRLLILLFKCEVPATKLPTPKGLEVSVHPGDAEHPAMLVLALLDQAQADIFYRLCLDVIEATRGASTEVEALASAVGRTWRWHHLLRGGGDGRLTIEEQKGLIGELLVLDRELLPRIATPDAVAAWVGPTGTPKDFELGTLAVEAKARRGTAEPFVAISSEYQLDSHGLGTLFLHVTDLARGTAESDGAFSVTDLARRVSARVLALDPGSVELFEATLAASGFSRSDDYSDCLWLEVGTRLYQIGAGFPRVAADNLESGVSHVTYRISLVECERFAVSADAIGAALNGDADVR